VLLYTGGAKTATLTHSGERNFIVRSVGKSSRGLVNEIGPYDGKVAAPAGPALWVIIADGNWTIAIT
jgi:hypothetical protein